MMYSVTAYSPVRCSYLTLTYPLFLYSMSHSNLVAVCSWKMVLLKQDGDDTLHPFKYEAIVPKSLQILRSGAKLATDGDLN